MFDLSNCNHREEFREKEKTSKEQTKSSQVKSQLPDGRRVIGTPAAGQKIPVDGSDYDHKAFEPHADIDYYRHKKGYRDVSAQFSEPENLRGQYIATHHDVI